jgi:glutathione synthase/RimK-type ligase-like ATP-grasp enzyme
MRLFVVAGRVAAAMTRRAATWITNVKQGGRPERLSPDPEVCRLALGAAAAVGAEFCGVDLIRDGEGRVQVLEVNSMPAWSGLQSVADCDIAGLIADAAAARLSQCRPLETVR